MNRESICSYIVDLASLLSPKTTITCWSLFWFYLKTSCLAAIFQCLVTIIRTPMRMKLVLFGDWLILWLVDLFQTFGMVKTISGMREKKSVPLGQKKDNIFIHIFVTKRKRKERIDFCRKWQRKEIWWEICFWRLEGILINCRFIKYTYKSGALLG